MSGSGSRSIEYRVVSKQPPKKVDLAAMHVFDADGPHQLVLITCGGYNEETDHHERTVVVFAEPVLAALGHAGDAGDALARGCGRPAAAGAAQSSGASSDPSAPDRVVVGSEAGANRATNSRQVWATSCQPWSIVSEWPRSGISTNSVTDGFVRCFL